MIFFVLFFPLKLARNTFSEPWRMFPSAPFLGSAFCYSSQVGELCTFQCLQLCVHMLFNLAFNPSKAGCSLFVSILVFHGKPAYLGTSACHILFFFFLTNCIQKIHIEHQMHAKHLGVSLNLNSVKSSPAFPGNILNLRGEVSCQ